MTTEDTGRPAQKIYGIRDEEGDVGLWFDTKAHALAHGGAESDMVEQVVYSGPPPRWTCWVRGAEVFPDGVVRDWSEERHAFGETTMSPVNGPCEPFDGHMQGHCGEHIYVSGTDRSGVEAAYQAALTAALTRQTGRCLSRHEHTGDIDGETVYDAGFTRVRRRGTPESVQMPCLRHWDHDFSEATPWHPVDVGCWNRQRVCSRCCICEIEVTTSDPDSTRGQS